MKFSRAQWILEHNGYLFESDNEWQREVDAVISEINAETDSWIGKVKRWLKGLVSHVKKFFGMDEADERLSRSQKTGYQGPEWARLEPDEVYGYETAAAAKEDHYGADKMGVRWQDCPNTIEYAKKAFRDGRCRDAYDCSWYDYKQRHSESDIKATEKRFDSDWNDYFAKQYAEIEKQIKEKGTITVYRGTGIGAWRDGHTYTDSAHFDDPNDPKKLMSKFKLMLRNAKLRNSWSMTSDVAVRYATHHEYRYLLVMECTMDEFSLPYSAWLEGHWKGHGARPARWAANDEINVFQSFKIRDIKIIALSTNAQKKFRQVTKTNCYLIDDSEPSNSQVQSLVKTFKFEK